MSDGGSVASAADRQCDHSRRRRDRANVTIDRGALGPTVIGRAPDR
jgi:hypothetical protein